MTFAEWKALAQRINGMAERIGRMRIDRAKRLALSVGISPDACCIHNAAIDTELRGWCAGPNGRHRNRVARAAKRIWDDNDYNRLAERIITRAWKDVRP